jgi:hypothetical protein
MRLVFAGPLHRVLALHNCFQAEGGLARRHRRGPEHLELRTLLSEGATDSPKSDGSEHALVIKASGRSRVSNLNGSPELQDHRLG